MHHDHGAQHHDPTGHRRFLGFASVSKLRERAAQVMTTGLYNIPDWDTRKRTAPATQQTEKFPVRDIGVCDGIADFDEERRQIDLRLGIPTPGDFPVLTVSQLIEAEKRVMELIHTLELAVGRCYDELESAKKASLNPFEQRGKYLNAHEWSSQMTQKVGERLRTRDSDTKRTWHLEKTSSAASPIRKQFMTASPRRERALQVARAPSFFQPSALVEKASTLHQLQEEQQRAVDEGFSKSSVTQED